MKSANEMAIESNVNGANALIEKGIKKQTREIELSAKSGIRYARWVLDTREFESVYHELVTIFKRQGYKLVPTGFIGGVWQMTQRIVW